MNDIIVALVAWTVSQALLAAADCDSTSTSKIQQCVFQAELFNPETTPKDEASIQIFCRDNMNGIVSCLESHMSECTEDAKGRKLLELLVSIPDTKAGLMYMCNNITILVEKAPCFSAFGQSSFYECLQKAVATITDVGEPSDIKSGLDMVCQFFDSFTGCFTDPFQDECAVVGVIYSRVFEGIKYPYCKMSGPQRQSAITQYELGADLSHCAVLRSSLSVMGLVFMSLLLFMSLVH